MWLVLTLPRLLESFQLLNLLNQAVQFPLLILDLLIIFLKFLIPLVQLGNHTLVFGGKVYILFIQLFKRDLCVAYLVLELLSCLVYYISVSFLYCRE